MNDNDNELWQNIESSLLSMNNHEFKVAIRELRELISITICDKLDELETSMLSLKESQSVINQFQSRKI